MAGTTSGFADGRHEVSPDSEQMEQTATVLLLRKSGSVEQIQDRREEPSRLKTKKEPLNGFFLIKWRERRGSNSGRFKTTCGEFSPLYSTTFNNKISPTSGLIFLLMAGTTHQGLNF